jgi:hypothetical protein
LYRFIKFVISCKQTVTDNTCSMKWFQFIWGSHIGSPAFTT